MQGHSTRLLLQTGTLPSTTRTIKTVFGRFPLPVRTLIYQPGIIRPTQENFGIFISGLLCLIGQIQPLLAKIGETKVCCPFFGLCGFY